MTDEEQSGAMRDDTANTDTPVSNDTFAAFAKAVDRRFKALETDVQRSLSVKDAMTNENAGLDGSAGDDIAPQNISNLVRSIADIQDVLNQVVSWIAINTGTVLTPQSHKDKLKAEASANLPVVANRAEYEALAPGAAYIDGMGVQRVK